MYFTKEPVKILYLMQQMSDRLRDTTKDYLEACQTLYESEEANKNNSEKSDDLEQRIRKFSDLHKDFDSVLAAFGDVQRITHCSTGCGGCHQKVLDIISEIMMGK